MRRVLVPLDGSPFAEAIIPDARRLAGNDGTLILVRDAVHPIYHPQLGFVSEAETVEETEAYLNEQAAPLLAEDVKVEAHALVLNDRALAIDEAARIFKADAIACATHGRGPLGRLVRGGVAWRALAHSPVPVLLRHVDEHVDLQPVTGVARRILCPLDGSEFSEKAIPVAEALGRDWRAPVHLVEIIPDMTVTRAYYGAGVLIPQEIDRAVKEASEYLDRIASTLDVAVRTQSACGSPVAGLIEYIDRFGITDVVMASHGHTGLPRVIFGSVTDALLHHLRLPIVVIPAMAHVEQTVGESEQRVLTPVG